MQFTVLFQFQLRFVSPHFTLASKFWNFVKGMPK